MRIVVAVRPDADIRPGGDVVQARAVARFLRSRGAVVSEQVTGRMDLHGTDVAVLLNLTLTDQVNAQARAAQRRGIPYVLFPVFWDLEALPDRPTGHRVLPVGSRRRELAQRLRGAASRGRAGVWDLNTSLLRRDRDVRRRVVEGAAFVHPNSRAELEHLQDYLGIGRPPWLPVRNGIWACELEEVARAARHRSEDVVSVGAISPRKNTLTLVRAAREVPRRVVVIGKHPRAGDAYAQRVRAEAPANVEFVGALPRSEVLLRLAAARAHVLPSHVETPGLATMEALALGTSSVAGDTGVVREYFTDLPQYVDPRSEPSVAAGIHRALGAELVPEHVAASIRAKFDWATTLAPVASELGLD